VWATLLFLLGVVLLAGGAWMLWRAVAAPEGMVPPDLTIRHAEELVRRGESVPEQDRERRLAERDELRARQAAEREAARSTARRQGVVAGLALVLGGVVLLGIGYERWRRPVIAASTSLSRRGR
jgi:hypothetical protein